MVTAPEAGLALLQQLLAHRLWDHHAHVGAEFGCLDGPAEDVGEGRRSDVGRQLLDHGVAGIDDDVPVGRLHILQGTDLLRLNPALHRFDFPPDSIGRQLQG